jgi:hypothetical protein
MNPTRSVAAPRVVPLQAAKTSVQTNTSDQDRPPAPRGFYIAVARSAVCSPPFLRGPPPNCDRTKNQTKHPGSRFRAGSLQLICRIFGERTCVRCRQIEQSQTQELRLLCPVVCRSGAGRRQADGFRSDEVMSGVVDRGRESGHGNIDANDPQRASQPNADLPELGSELLSKGPLTFGGDHHSARSIDAPNPLLLEAVGTYGRPDCSR